MESVMASVAPQISRWLSVFALLWGLAVANKCDGCVTQYDGLQRPGTITDAAGGVTSHVYGLNSGGNAFDSSGFKPTMVVDVDGYTTLVTNDALYRTTQTAVGYATGLWSATNTAYDAVGNAVQVTDPLGNVTTTGYDALNRVVSKTFADGTTNSLGYTSTGLKWRAVDELGQVTTIVYDGAGRATKVQAPPLSDGTQAVTQTVYDAAGNAVATINALGYRTDVTYDAVNRLLTTTDGAGITVTYQYDLVGNRTAVIDGKENTTAFQYDGLKRNTQSTDALGQATVLGYDALNKVSRTDASGQATAYGYDQRNRLLTTNYGAGAPENRTYVYDPAGRLLSVSEPGQGGLADVAYGYDAMNRVVSETAGGCRYYDPRLGRWLSRDPMGESGGFNLYAYCGNDPVNRWDYLGMATEEERHTEAAQALIMQQLYRTKAARERDPEVAASLRAMAEEAGVQADMLGHATEGNYRQDWLRGKYWEHYDVNSPGAWEAAHFYADQFNDKAALAYMDRNSPPPAGLRRAGPKGTSDGFGTPLLELFLDAALLGLSPRLGGEGEGSYSPKSAPSKWSPRGVSSTKFDAISKLLRKCVGHLGDKIVVQGSRVSGTAKSTSDLDIAIIVPEDVFAQQITEAFGTYKFGTANGRTMLHALEVGKITAGRAGLRALRKELEDIVAMDVDLSIVQKNGAFDSGAQAPIR